MKSLTRQCAVRSCYCAIFCPTNTCRSPVRTCAKLTFDSRCQHPTMTAYIISRPAKTGRRSDRVFGVSNNYIRRSDDAPQEIVTCRTGVLCSPHGRRDSLLRCFQGRASDDTLKGQAPGFCDATNIPLAVDLPPVRSETDKPGTHVRGHNEGGTSAVPRAQPTCSARALVRAMPCHAHRLSAALLAPRQGESARSPTPERSARARRR